MKWTLVLALGAVLSACGGDSTDSDNAPPATKTQLAVTPSRTPRPRPTSIPTADTSAFRTQRGGAYAQLIDIGVQRRETDPAAVDLAKGTCISISDGVLGEDSAGNADKVTLAPICLAVLKEQWGTAEDQLNALFRRGER